MDTLRKAFEEDIRVSIRESRKLGYNPARFIQMLQDSDAVSLAKRLVVSGELQDGFKKMKALGRLDLTMENLMLNPKYSELFTKQELAAAKWRLEQVKLS